jgi:hypothetical protein
MESGKGGIVKPYDPATPVDALLIGSTAAQVPSKSVIPA